MTEAAHQVTTTAAPLSARKVHRELMLLWIKGIIVPGLITIFLCFLALELTVKQWWMLVGFIPPCVAFYALPEAWLAVRLNRPLIHALARLEHRPEPELVSQALVRALNLPYYGFLRVALLRGPLGACSAGGALFTCNLWLGGDFQFWQIVMFMALVLFFACPAYAMVEYFLVSRHLVPVVENLWQHCSGLERADQRALIAVRLKTKLLYLCVFITALPLIFVAATVLFKVHLLLTEMAVPQPMQQLWPLLRWLLGALLVCITGAFMVSLMTAQEVSRSASRLIGGMNEVERGNLDIDLKVLGTDEYADLTRGFNLMTDGLRDEVRILEVSQSLAGELKLDVLIARILGAATELLDADRATLLVHDPETAELWSRYGDGLKLREIRIADTAGIAGAVFGSGLAENIPDAYADPRFNSEVDRDTGYHTHSMLCMPIINQAGLRIGVTQVLNKKGGNFTFKDEQRLAAFTAQIAVMLENAKLFDEVLAIKGYNENILASITNGVITVNQQRKLVTANLAALRILGSGTVSPLGRPAGEVFEAANSWVLHSIEKVLASGETELAVDTELVQQNGAKASVNLTVTPLRDALQDTIGCLLSFEDQTDEKRVKSTMARYMSKEVADQLLSAGEAVLGGKLQKVSILFSDVRSFTTVAEAMGARETVSMLNEYFERMVEEIFRHQGILDKYIGDAIMALFGSPFAGPADADHAVATATAMMRALRLLNAERAAADKPALAIGIGIATGEVIVGNIGSPRRMEYTVIGDGVNLASRLEGATKQYGTGILMSESTLLSLRESVPVREIDRLRVKGKDKAVTVFEALGYHDETSFPQLSRCLVAYNAGLAAYRARDWLAAEAAFAEALVAHPGDRPSQIYLQRSAQYRSRPPPEDWDGIWTLVEK